MAEHVSHPKRQFQAVRYSTRLVQMSGSAKGYLWTMATEQEQMWLMVLQALQALMPLPTTCTL